MDILKYGFNIDAAADEMATAKRRYYDRRQRRPNGRARDDPYAEEPNVAVRFQYIHA